MYKKRDDAKAYVIAQNFRGSITPDPNPESANLWRFRQIQPHEFVGGTFRTIPYKKDKRVHLVVGHIKSQPPTVPDKVQGKTKHRDKIPRADIKELDKYLRGLEKAHKGSRVTIVGSYRRGKAFSGDVDILLRGVTLDEALEYIRKRYDVPRIISKGKMKSSFSLVLGGKSRRVDMLQTTSESYIPALVYFTGSRPFNIHQRAVAKHRGLKLSEHGLTDSSGRRVHVSSEQDLFKKLDMTYVEPHARDT